MRRVPAYGARPASYVEAYVLARHHGLPTRLLDWTTSALAALFFACVADLDKPGRLFFLDVSWPSCWEKQWKWPPSTEDAGAFRGADKGPLRWDGPTIRDAIEALFLARAPKYPSAVFPFLPPVVEPRLQQQGSTFTLHAPGSQPIPEPWVTSVIVPPDAKLGLLQELHLLGVEWSTLFPDLDHLAMELSEGWYEPMEGEGYRMFVRDYVKFGDAPPLYLASDVPREPPADTPPSPAPPAEEGA